MDGKTNASAGGTKIKTVRIIKSLSTAYLLSINFSYDTTTYTGWFNEYRPEYYCLDGSDYGKTETIYSNYSPVKLDIQVGQIILYTSTKKGSLGSESSYKSLNKSTTTDAELTAHFNTNIMPMIDMDDGSYLIPLIITDDIVIYRNVETYSGYSYPGIKIDVKNNVVTNAHLNCSIYKKNIESSKKHQLALGSIISLD